MYRTLLLALGLTLSLTLTGCGALSQFWPGGRAQTPPTVTPTRIPLPTVTVAPTPRIVATQPPASQATARPPAAQALPGVSNFTARFTGRAVEGSFDLAGERIQYIYRLQNLGVAGSRLQASGVIEYTRASGSRGVIPDVTATVATAGDSCERIALETSPLAVPELNTTIPAQQMVFNLAEVQGGANPAVSAVCQLARTIQANPNNPLIGFLLDQVNRQLR